jgi:hypothetical protein
VKLIINMNLDNSAFADNPDEVAKCLDRVAGAVQSLLDNYRDSGEGRIRDSNGNTVGEWVVTSST